jgi:hypothetical protein
MREVRKVLGEITYLASKQRLLDAAGDDGGKEERETKN